VALSGRNAFDVSIGMKLQNYKTSLGLCSLHVSREGARITAIMFNSCALGNLQALAGRLEAIPHTTFSSNMLATLLLAIISQPKSDVLLRCN
jgi:hypothetical protein